MTKIKISSQVTTYDWLLSILKNSLILAVGKIEFWQSKRAYAVECRDEEKYKDQVEYDSWSERIEINDNFEVSTELVKRLLIAVEGNPYPGRQMRVQQVAVEQVSGVRKFTWRLILEDSDFGFPPNFANEKVSFPALNIVAVEDIEAILYNLVREDNTILAVKVPEALNMGASSKGYREVKNILKTRGWRWEQKWESGKNVKVIIPPA
jgi:hypothetical protein